MALYDEVLFGFGQIPASCWTYTCDPMIVRAT